jgi:hypothetical protein
MIDLAKLYATNPKSETDGIDLHLGGDCYISIRRAGGANRQFAEVFRRVTAPHRQVIDRGMLDAETDDALGIEIYSQCVVIGWRGVVVRGAPVEFSRENFVRVMKELPELWRVIRDEARNAANFRDQEIADAGKS